MGRRYELEYFPNSDTVKFHDDLNCIKQVDGKCFADIICMDDRPLKSKPVFDAGDFGDEFVPDPRDPNHDSDVDCDMYGIEAIARDVVPVPEGPKTTESLRQYRFKPELY